VAYVVTAFTKKTFSFNGSQLTIVFALLSNLGYNNKMNVQLTAHPHLYQLIIWFEKEELLVQQLVIKIRSQIPVHKRKQTVKTIIINKSLQNLWDDYKGGKINVKKLLLESSKWIAKKM
jgi:hypothetical protein